MAIEPTGLNELLTPPEKKADSGNARDSGDFMKLLSAATPAKNAGDSLPTDDVGNPTPATGAATARDADETASEAVSGAPAGDDDTDPLEAVINMADQITLDAGNPASNAAPAKTGASRNDMDGKFAEAGQSAGLRVSVPALAGKNGMTGDGKAKPADESDTDKAEKPAGDNKDQDAAGDGSAATILDALPQPPVAAAASNAPPSPLVQAEAAASAVAVSATSTPDNGTPAADDDGTGEGPAARAMQLVQPGQTMQARAATALPPHADGSAAQGQPHGAQASHFGDTLADAAADALAAMPAADDHSSRQDAIAGAPAVSAAPSAAAAADATASQALAALTGQSQTPAPATAHAAAHASDISTTAAAAPQHQLALEDLLVGNAVQDQWVDRLSRDVQTLISSDNREARLNLHPRELGDLAIRLNMGDGQAKVHFTVDNHAAQQIIADAMPKLQTMMENRGFRLDQASVGLGANTDGGSARNGAGSGQGSAGNGQAAASSYLTRAAAPAAQAVARQIVRATAFERYA